MENSSPAMGQQSPALLWADRVLHSLLVALRRLLYKEQPQCTSHCCPWAHPSTSSLPSRSPTLAGSHTPGLPQAAQCPSACRRKPVPAAAQPLSIPTHHTKMLFYVGAG